MGEKNAGAYDPDLAGAYWGYERFANCPSDTAAVLGYADPNDVNAAYAEWERIIVRRCLRGVPSPFARVLDLGCGIGRMFPVLLEYADHIIGVDVATGMLARAARVADAHSGRVTLIQASVGKLPLDSACVDAVVCLGLFEHLPASEQRNALREIARVLTPNGLVILEVNNSENRDLYAPRENAFRLGRQLANGYYCGVVDGLEVRRSMDTVHLRQVRQYCNPWFGLAKSKLVRPGRTSAVRSVGIRLAPIFDSMVCWKGPLVRRAQQVIFVARGPATFADGV